MLEPSPLMWFSRRQFVGVSFHGLMAGLTAACLNGSEEDEANDGRLTARPGAVTGTVQPGITGLNFGGFRDGVLLVPAGYTASQPVPLMVLLHGAGGLGSQVLQRFVELADELRVAVLAPDSRTSTWDRISTGSFRGDVTFINRALENVFSRVAVDPARIALGGFSDGASYALSLGLTNGDLFTRVVAFSPGFAAPNERFGMPPIFVSHGTGDQVLPIDATSRQIVPDLEDMGYGVRYREFNGGHTIPTAIAREGMEWLAGSASVPSPSSR